MSDMHDNRIYEFPPCRNFTIAFGELSKEAVNIVEFTAVKIEEIKKETQ